MVAIDPRRTSGRAPARGGRLWTALTFDRLITGPVIHLVYWSGLGVIVVGAFSVVGASIGVAWREGSWAALLLALPVLVVGLLVVAAMALIWRAFCEFFVAVIRIGDDLAALRRSSEAGDATLNDRSRSV
jgi:hypothetical protein